MYTNAFCEYMYWCGTYEGGREGGREGRREGGKQRNCTPFDHCGPTSLSLPPSRPPCLVSQHYLRMSDGIFITIKGTLPRVSSGLFGGKAPVADLDAYDVRYLSYT